MNPEQVYEKGVQFSDIATHLPFLRDSAKGDVFEIGVRDGVSTSALLLGVKEHGGHLWSLDLIDAGHLYSDPEWTFIKGDSRDSEYVLSLLPSQLDVLFIDSDHSYEVTLTELSTYGPLVRPDGAILLHDVDLTGVGVRGALEHYAEKIGRRPSYMTGSFGLGMLIP